MLELVMKYYLMMSNHNFSCLHTNIGANHDKTIDSSLTHSASIYASKLQVPACKQLENLAKNLIGIAANFTNVFKAGELIWLSTK